MSRRPSAPQPSLVNGVGSDNANSNGANSNAVRDNTLVRDDHLVRDASGYISTAIQPERAVLAQLVLDTPRMSTHVVHGVSVESNGIGPSENIDESTDSSMDELAGLCEAANAIVVGRVSQKRDKPHPATLFGKGKADEIAQLCRDENVDVLVVDRELSPAQGRNLERLLKVRVIDRTELILDIFARRAQTKQAKLQVELAQLRYQLPRLKRMWTHLSRIGGGIGLRGPGETQLETDRRLAGERIAFLQEKLDEIRRQKTTESVGRLDYELGALVGYTNVGKSALLNALSSPTGRGVLVADQLFATLGASTRKLELGGGRAILLTDTVGLVRRLPHNLVESFHSTLAEVQQAHVLLLVADAADPELDDKMKAVREVIDELKVSETPRILVLNQCDRVSLEDRQALLRTHRDAIFTSALTGEGLDDLKARILQTLEADEEEIVLTLDASQSKTGKLISDIARHGRVLDEDWSIASEDGSRPQVRVRARLAPRWREKLGLEKGHAVRAAA